PPINDRNELAVKRPRIGGHGVETQLIVIAEVLNKPLEQRSLTLNARLATGLQPREVDMIPGVWEALAQGVEPTTAERIYDCRLLEERSENVYLLHPPWGSRQELPPDRPVHAGHKSAVSEGTRLTIRRCVVNHARSISG